MVFDFYDWFEASKKEKVFKLNDIAVLLNKEYDAVRMAIKRKSFSDLEKKEIFNKCGANRIEQTEPNKIENGISLYNDDQIGIPDNEKIAEYIIVHYEDLSKVERFKLLVENIELKAENKILAKLSKA